MKWKLINEVEGIPKNAILKQINSGFKKNTLSRLSEVKSNKEKFVVIEYLGSQKILKVGKDIIPYSHGVINWNGV